MDERQELIDKVGRLVASRFDGDFRKAFDHYAGNSDGLIGRGDLMELLKDAGIGNWLTRNAWVRGVLAELDRDGDGSISFEELEAVLK